MVDEEMSGYGDFQKYQTLVKKAHEDAPFFN